MREELPVVTSRASSRLGHGLGNHLLCNTCTHCFIKSTAWMGGRGAWHHMKCSVKGVCVFKGFRLISERWYDVVFGHTQKALFHANRVRTVKMLYSLHYCYMNVRRRHIPITRTINKTCRQTPRPSTDHDNARFARAGRRDARACQKRCSALVTMRGAQWRRLHNTRYLGGETVSNYSLWCSLGETPKRTVAA